MKCMNDQQKGRRDRERYTHSERDEIVTVEPLCSGTAAPACPSASGCENHPHCIDDSGSLLYETPEKGDQKHKSTYDIYLFVFWVHKKCSLFLEHTINDNNCCEKISYQQIYVLIFQCIPEIKKCAQIGLGAAYYRIPIDSFHWELYVR